MFDLYTIAIAGLVVGGMLGVLFVGYIVFYLPSRTGTTE